MTQSPRLRHRQMRAAIRRNPPLTISMLLAELRDRDETILRLVALLECDELQRMN